VYSHVSLLEGPSCQPARNVSAVSLFAHTTWSFVLFMWKTYDLQKKKIWHERKSHARCTHSLFRNTHTVRSLHCTQYLCIVVVIVAYHSSTHLLFRNTHTHSKESSLYAIPSSFTKRHGIVVSHDSLPGEGLSLSSVECMGNTCFFVELWKPCVSTYQTVGRDSTSTPVSPRSLGCGPVCPFPSPFSPTVVEGNQR